MVDHCCEVIGFMLGTFFSSIDEQVLYELYKSEHSSHYNYNYGLFKESKEQFFNWRNHLQEFQLTLNFIVFKKHILISGKILQKHRLHNSISVILTHFMVRNRQFPKVQIVFVLSSKPQIRFVLPKKKCFCSNFYFKERNNVF